jgi:6-phosphogluconolactonase
MTFTRRQLGISLAALAFAAAPFAAIAAPKGNLVYVGQKGTKIHALRFDPARGSLVLVGAVATLDRPTWTVADAKRSVLYVANEAGNDGKRNGSAVAFHVDRATGALTKISEADAGGGGTTNLWYDAPSSTLLAANYGGGSAAAIPVERDGSLGVRVSLVKSVGIGPHRRQASPHAHGVAVDPSGKFALVADLGADKLFVYPFDRRTRSLSEDAPGKERHFALPPGSGPRHFAFAPNGRFVYLLSELTAELRSFRWDAAKGQLTSLQAQSTNAPDFKGDSSVSEIVMSRDGRFVYVGNRGENTLLVYRAAANGQLDLVQRLPSGGDFPWSFAIHPNGRWMLVANKGSGTVNVFAVDPRTGKLSATTASAPVPDVCSVSFLP